MSAEKRPEWMTSISATVDPQDYLLGRKIDKTFELSQKEKSERAREAKIELIARDELKLTGDPILDLEKRKQALRSEFLSNPIKLKQLRDRLLKEEREKQSNSSGSKDNESIRGECSADRVSGSSRKELDSQSDTRKSEHTPDNRNRSPSSSSPDLSRSSRSNSARKKHRQEERHHQKHHHRRERSRSPQHHNNKYYRSYHAGRHNKDDEKRHDRNCDKFDKAIRHDYKKSSKDRDRSPKYDRGHRRK